MIKILVIQGQGVNKTLTYSSEAVLRVLPAEGKLLLVGFMGKYEEESKSISAY